MKTLIFGNSGAGKSTLARRLSKQESLAHLDLDTIAWLPQHPPVRMPIEDSKIAIRGFCDKHPRWVVEGCYTDLLSLLIPEASEVVFLNPGVTQCIENARNRPWEPHKYESEEAQDKNLGMLIEWIKDYYKRDGIFSLQAHRALFDSYLGNKKEYLENWVLT